MKNSKSTMLWGLILLLIGTIILGNNINMWNVEIFFDGWWTLFIIIPSFIGLIKKEFVSSSLGLSIGILLLLAAQDIIKWQMVGKIFIPLILIIIGLSLVFKPQLKKKVKKLENKNAPEYLALFSGCEEKITGSFKGAKCISVFGGIDLDLRDAKITNDVVINCITIFGGIDLLMPNNINVKTTGTPIFGGIENKTNNKEKNKPTIYINYTCIFAGIDIK